MCEVGTQAVSTDLLHSAHSLEGLVAAVSFQLALGMRLGLRKGVPKVELPHRSLFDDMDAPGSKFMSNGCGGSDKSSFLQPSGLLAAPVCFLLGTLLSRPSPSWWDPPSVTALPLH